MDPESNPPAEESEPEELPPDPSITREMFLEWRSPREGASNPEIHTNPVWSWLIRSRWNAWRTNTHFNGPESMDAGPAWCFSRFGQSVTRLPDGREVLIAGEHEDHYDPDFQIYNDVVVRHPDGGIEILGYPKSVFPPTDFHSATRAGDRIVVIGNLGYPADRRPGQTPVFALDLKTWAFSPVATGGEPPGWISEHAARLTDDGTGIVVTGGVLDRGDPNRSLVENIDDWCLHLADGRWERLTVRDWPRWEVRRTDGQRLHLFEYQQAIWERQFPELKTASSLLEGLEIPTLEEQLGGPPEIDLFTTLFRPGLPHEVVPDEPESKYGVHRIRVNGVIVRYVEQPAGVQMTVEGRLPESVNAGLVEDLQDKLARLERTACVTLRL